MVVVDTLLSASNLVLADSHLSTQLHSISDLSTRRTKLYTSGGRSLPYQALRDQLLSAGVRLFLTNTFDAGRFQLQQIDLAAQTTLVNRQAAKQLRSVFATVDEPIAIAGSVSLAPPTVSYADQVAAVAEQAEALSQGGVDVLWAESLTAMSEIDALLAGCQLGAPQLRLIVTLGFRPNFTNPFKMTPKLAAQRLAQSSQVLAIGADTSCGDWRIEQSLAMLKTANPNKILAAKLDSDALAIDMSLEQDAVTRTARMARTVTQLGTRILALDHKASPARFRAVREAASSAVITTL